MSSGFRSLRRFIRRRRRLVKFVFLLVFLLGFLLFAAVAAFFYLFVMTASIALHITEASGWAIGFGAFLYIQLWLLVTDSAADAAAELYGIRVWSPFQWLIPPSKQGRGALILFFFLSYVIAIYGFALAYVAVSRYFIGSFNVGGLDLIGGIYFSVATIGTVGFGDIVPVSSLARLMVVGEIFLGLAYGVFFFSIIACFLREKPVDNSPTIPPSRPKRIADARGDKHEWRGQLADGYTSK
jgi:hypothetical protein